MNTLLHILLTIILNLRNMLLMTILRQIILPIFGYIALTFHFLRWTCEPRELNDILHYVYKSDAIHDVIHQVNPV